MNRVANYRGLAAIASILAALVLTACGTNDPSPAVTPASTQSTTTQPTENSATVTDSEGETSAPETEVGATETLTTEEEAVVLPTPTESPDELPAPTFDPAQTSLALEESVTGLNLPLFATHAGDGSNRIFVVEKRGTIRVLQEGALLGDPFLDIIERVGSAANEQGLLGLAFDPAFAESRYFWVQYTDRNGDTVISRFSVTNDPNRADAASEFVTLTFDQPFQNHNGGMLVFGPDGMLWIGTGDGGSGGDPMNNGQNPATLLGKMLRIDVTSDPSQPYTIPADNPWPGGDTNGTAVAPEVWAIGLRNPWRYSFDRLTGDLWIADVGQNAWEEVHYVAGGSPGRINFGWNIMEGTHCYRSANCDQTGLTLPVAEYDHSGHCSITGGYVYRGAAYPQLSGVYFYGDYCSGRVWALFPDGSGGWTNPVAFDAPVTLSSFGEDEAGELYLVDYSGALYRLVVAQ